MQQCTICTNSIYVAFVLSFLFKFEFYPNTFFLFFPTHHPYFPFLVFIPYRHFLCIAFPLMWLLNLYPVQPGSILLFLIIIIIYQPNSGLQQFYIDTYNSLKNHNICFYQRDDICRLLCQTRSYFYSCSHSDHSISKSEKNEKIDVVSPSCGMANETVHTISRSKKIVSRYLKKCEQKQYYTCGTHYLGPGKKYMLLKPHLWDG